MEGWQSGRLRRSWKPLIRNRVRRFESFTLRQKMFTNTFGTQLSTPQHFLKQCDIYIKNNKNNKQKLWDTLIIIQTIINPNLINLVAFVMSWSLYNIAVDNYITNPPRIKNLEDFFIMEEWQIKWLQRTENPKELDCNQPAPQTQWCGINHFRV